MDSTCRIDAKLIPVPQKCGTNLTLNASAMPATNFSSEVPPTAHISGCRMSYTRSRIICAPSRRVRIDSPPDVGIGDRSVTYRLSAKLRELHASSNQVRSASAVMPAIRNAVIGSYASLASTMMRTSSPTARRNACTLSASSRIVRPPIFIFMPWKPASAYPTPSSMKRCHVLSLRSSGV